jgi:hypothetical protein
MITSCYRYVVSKANNTALFQLSSAFFEELLPSIFCCLTASGKEESTIHPLSQ